MVRIPDTLGSEGLTDGYNYRPGLIALINCGASAAENAKATGLNIQALDAALQVAQKTASQPIEEESYVIALRTLRREICALDVPEAKLQALNQFQTEKW